MIDDEPLIPANHRLVATGNPRHSRNSILRLTIATPACR